MSSDLVFITGATGFIGSHVLNVTLQAGYRVRISIRKSEQIELVKNRYPSFADKLEFTVISDITQVDAFHKALQGVDYVFHLASPMPGKGEDLKSEYVDPAVKGTVAILEAARQHTTVKTVIIVASVLSLGPVNATQLPSCTIKDNTGEVIPVNLEMEVASGPAGYGIKYTASKILAHQASRDFMESKKPQFNLITFHPTYVLGHDLTQMSAEGVGGINKFIWSSLSADKPPVANVWVHVHDVAEAFVRAIDEGENIKSGTEFLLSAPHFRYEEVYEYINKNYSQIGLKWQPPFAFDWHVDTTTADTLLKLPWKKHDAIVKDVLDQQLGFLKGNM